MLEIAIFTREYNDKLEKLINDLQNQIFSDFKIKIFSDKKFYLKNIDIIHNPNKNISQKRNQAINECKTKYLFLLDDDNRIYNPNFLKNMFLYYEKINKNYWPCIISPTIFWRNTNIIQSAWIKFSFLLWKVFANKNIKWKYRQTKWIWWNSLFGKKEYFQKASFDEEIGFIREDIDYAYSLWEKWVNIFVVKEKINHMEKDKTPLEKSFLKWEAYYRKIKNRNIFVKKHWNLMEKIAYYMCGYWLGIIVWKIKRKITK